MNNPNYSHSPTYQYQQQKQKNGRLYQQLLQNNYLNDHIYYQPNSNNTQAAQIRFNNNVPPPIKIPSKLDKTMEYQRRDDSYSRQSKTAQPFKTFDSMGGRTSHQATQSLGSNYSITQIQNQSYSTLNLYSLSRNQGDMDLDLSSNNITTKLNIQDQHMHDIIHEQDHKNQDNMILDSSINSNNKKQDISCLDSQDKFKKYRSEEYQYQKESLNNQQNQQDDQGKVPKILADKYLKNDITKKFSANQSQQNQNNSFKTVLNQIHVVPYNINQQFKPYAFSVPIQNNSQVRQITNSSVRPTTQVKRVLKANSLNLNHSNQSSHDNDEDMTISPTKHLYFSNHPHLHPAKCAQFTYHTPSLQEGAKYIRITPKSQPKYQNTISNDKNNRSNSIESKSKPIINLKTLNAQSNMAENGTSNDRLEQSRVTKIFKNDFNLPLTQQKQLQHSPSVIYQSNVVNICCGTNNSSQTLTINQSTNANKINFLPNIQKIDGDKQKGSSSFFIDPMASFDLTNMPSLQRNKLPNYKINPIQMIKTMNDTSQSDKNLKKGLKLVGFNPIFRKSEEE